MFLSTCSVCASTSDAMVPLAGSTPPCPETKIRRSKPIPGEYGPTGAGRFGESLAVLGSVRAYATAEFRASLNLGLNPKEHEWVGQRVVTALDTIESIVRREDEISAKKAEMDAEIDPMLMTAKRHRYEAALDARQRWENEQDPATLANAELVRKHRHELVPSR